MNRTTANVEPSAAPTPEGGPSVLAAENLHKSFGPLRAVDGVDFHVRAGETYGLLGPNGAGKTTVISMVAGILQPDAGEVRILERTVTRRSPAVRAEVGYVPQELALYPDLTGRENLTFFARLYGLDRRRAKARVEEVLHTIGLADRADEASSRYSGGMKRRLNIGAGLLHAPRLLILDEPTVGVDPQSRNAILEAIEALSQEGMSVLYTTHYMEEAERLCDRVGIIDGGRIRAEGTRRELVDLVGGQEGIEVSATGDLEAAAEAARRMDGITSASVRDGGLDVLALDASGLLAPLLARVTAAGATVRGVELRTPDLEDVFLHLTGKALRD